MVVASPDSPALELHGRNVALPADGSRTRRLVDEAMSAARLVVVDMADTPALARADAFLTSLRGDLAPGDTLIVASLTPPRGRLDTRRFLSAIAIVGPGVRPGELTSSSTERDGIVTIPDVSRTILERLGARVPGSMTGRPMRVISDANAVDNLAGLERDLIHASILRSPLLRATVFAASIAIVLALGIVLAGAAGGVFSVWRAALDVVLIGVAGVPLLLMLQPIAGDWSLTTTAVVLAAVAIAAAVLLRAAVGPRRALTAVFAATAIVVLVDLVTGGGLAERSSLSYLIVEGARFHGIGNELMGVVIAAAMLSIAALLDTGPTRQRLTVATAVLALVAIVMALPRFGDKFGSIPAAIPAFAAFVVLAAGRRFDIRGALAIASVTVLAAALIVVVDKAGGGTHISRSLGSGTGEILGRKAGAAARLLAFSYWMTAIVAALGSAALLAWRRGALVGRALWGRPATRRAVIACGVAAVGSVAANDAGVIAAAWISLFGGATLLSAMLTPEQH